MKLYKMRLVCTGYQDVVIKASSKKKAREIAERYVTDHDYSDMEFCEFLTLDDGDKAQYEEE